VSWLAIGVCVCCAVRANACYCGGEAASPWSRVVVISVLYVAVERVVRSGWGTRKLDVVVSGSPCFDLCLPPFLFLFHGLHDVDFLSLSFSLYDKQLLRP
jgi:hypothetical protein